MYQLLRVCSLGTFIIATFAALRIVAYDPIPAFRIIGAVLLLACVGGLIDAIVSPYRDDVPKS